MDRQKILIVDDDSNICELLRMYLEKDAFDTAIAGDGQQGAPGVGRVGRAWQGERGRSEGGGE